MIKYIRGVKKELDKVSWLSVAEVRERLLMVIVMLIIMLMYFGIIDVVVGFIKGLM